jgi:REP element-mobilizing transposase RayT
MSKRIIIGKRFITPAGINTDETGWRSRGYLPHFDSPDGVQFVTFRLAGSVPQSTFRRLRSELETGLITDIEYYRRVEAYLDAGHGNRFLAEPEVASMVEENLLHFHGDRYELFHWVLMPTHAHISLRPAPGQSLATIMHSLKSYTGTQANKTLRRSGGFWAKEYFDRFIRDGRHFNRVADYIHRNPVKARLCSLEDEWRFGCARDHQERTHAG